MTTKEELAKLLLDADLMATPGGNNYDAMAAAILERYDLCEKWVPVSERLPEDREIVFGWKEHAMTNPVVVRYVGGREFHDFFKNWVAVDFWRPLPAAPQKV